MAIYATQEDFERYVEGWETTDIDALERLLTKAEEQINRYIDGTPDELTGLKIDVLDLVEYQRRELANAVCAQAEYRLHWGEEFFLLPQVPVEGEEYSTDKKMPHIAPKAKVHLREAGLIAMLGRLA